MSLTKGVIIDLSDEIKAICRVLDVDYELVTKIVLRPSEAAVTVTRLKTDETGHKYIIGDPGHIADEELTFRIAT